MLVPSFLDEEELLFDVWESAFHKAHFDEAHFFSYSPLSDLQIGEAIRRGSKNDLFLHYIFMDNTFELPTGLGLPLQVSFSGVITPGIQAGVKLDVADVSLFCSSFDSSGCSFPSEWVSCAIFNCVSSSR